MLEMVGDNKTIDSALYQEVCSRTEDQVMRANMYRELHLARDLDEVHRHDMFPDLAHDADTLFAGTRAGHMLRHVFNDKATPLFDAFTKHAPQYLATEEIGIINDSLPYFKFLSKVARAHSQDGTLSVIELGTGKAFAQQFKTIPTVEAISPDLYVGIDFSHFSAFESMILVKDHFAKAAGHPVAADTRISDFTRDSFRLNDTGGRIFTMYGNTLSNIEGFSHSLPHDQMNKVIGNIRRHMNKGDYLFLGLQQDQSEDTSYQHPLFYEFHRHFLGFMKEAMYEDANFKPDDFEFFVRWDAKVANHVFGYRAKCDGSVRPLSKGAVRHYKKDDEFITCNSWRFNQEFLDQVYTQNVLKLQKVLARPNGHMAVHVLQAA